MKHNENMSEQNQNRNNRSRNHSDRNRGGGGGGNNRNRRSGGGGGNGGGNRRSGGSDRGGSEASRKRNELQPSHSRRRNKPEPLTFWQKIMKAIGLYKEPVAQPKNERTKSSPAKKKNGRVAGGGRVEAKNSGGDNSKPKPKGKGNQRNRDADRKAPPTEVKSPRLYVGNLSYDATEYDLEELFKGIGSIRNVELVYNRHTHKSKGYGFITMANVEEAERAVEVLHDQPFMGRKMIVNGARSTGANKSSDSGQERPRRAAKKSTPRKTTSDDIPAEEEVHSLAPKED